jgi:Co/Zn/Cd efflux system component
METELDPRPINSVVPMAHYRKPLAAAVALNSAIFVVEAVAGFAADSLSLVMDSVHNLSDELALLLSSCRAESRAICCARRICSTRSAWC